MKTKICNGMLCKGKEKLISEFGKHSDHTDGLSSFCKECEKIYQKGYRDKPENKKKAKEYAKKYRDKNKIELAKQKENHHKQFPWKRILSCIKQRCNNPKSEDYKNYGLRGIKNNITEEEIKELWFRDKAYNMIKPSIDREDNDGNYEFDNCRFIELGLNVTEKNKRVFSKAVSQYNLEGKFIKEFLSTREAERNLGIAHSSIGACCNGKLKTSGGFIWKYKND